MFGLGRGKDLEIESLVEHGDIALCGGHEQSAAMA